MSNTDLSPLDLLSNKNLDELTIVDVKNEKKKILLKFQLSQKSTVIINNYEVDKNTVISLFDTLIEDFDNLLFYSRIEPLKKMSSVEGLKLFNSTDSLNFDQYSEYKREGIYLKLSSKVANILVEPILSNRISFQEVKNISSYFEENCPDLITNTFSPLYKAIQDKIDSLENYTIEEIFVSSNSMEVKNSVATSVDIKLYKYLKSLPQMFSYLKTEYAKWCENFASTAFEKDDTINNFPKSSLIVLQKALAIAHDEFKKDYLKENLSLVTRELKGKKVEVKSSSGVKMFLIIFVGFQILLSIYSKTSEIRNKEKPNIWTTKTKSEKTISESNGFIIEQLRKNLFALPNDINSTKPEYFTFSKISHETKKDKIVLKYTANEIPGPYFNYKSLIPSTLLNNNITQISNVEFHFLLPNKEVIIHGLNYDFTNQQVIPDSTLYTPYKIDQVQQLLTKRFDKHMFNYSGNCQYINTRTKKIEKELDFKMIYQEGIESYICIPENDLIKILDTNIIANYNLLLNNQFYDRETSFYSGLLSNIYLAHKAPNFEYERPIYEDYINFDFSEQNDLPALSKFVNTYVDKMTKSNVDGSLFISSISKENASQYIYNSDGKLISIQFTVVSPKDDRALRIILHSK